MSARHTIRRARADAEASFRRLDPAASGPYLQASYWHPTCRRGYVLLRKRHVPKPTRQEVAA